MLHGRVVRPATVNSKPASVDEDSIKDIPGIVKIVREGSFVGVVAQTEWAAIQAAKALKVTGRLPRHKLPANAEEVYDYLEDEELRATAGGESRERGRGDLASRQDLRSDVPLALPDARHDGAVLRRGRRAAEIRPRSGRAVAGPL